MLSLEGYTALLVTLCLKPLPGGLLQRARRLDIVREAQKLDWQTIVFDAEYTERGRRARGCADMQGDACEV